MLATDSYATEPPVTPGAATHASWLRGLLVAVLVLNLADLMLTTAWVESGAAAEANPLMAVAVEWGWPAFAAVKLALVSLGVMILWRSRARPLGVFGIGIAFVAYYAILAQHAFGFGEWLAYSPAGPRLFGG